MAIAASVIIPTFNRAVYLQETIASVLRQTWQDFELVLVDDGSTDNTADIVRSFDDRRIRYIYRSNGGISAARNTGLDAARGEYIAFLDSDDLWEPSKLELQMAFMTAARTGLAFTDFQRFNDKHDQDRLFAYLRSDLEELPTEQIFSHAYRIEKDAFIALAPMRMFASWVQTSLIKRELVRDIRFDTTLHLSEDFAYMLRVYQRVRAGYIDLPLVRVRRHPGNSTKQASAHLQPRLRALQSLQIERPEYRRLVKRLTGRAFAALGYDHYAAGEFSEARAAYLKALRYSGSRATAIKHLLLTLLHFDAT